MKRWWAAGAAVSLCLALTAIPAAAQPVGARAGGTPPQPVSLWTLDETSGTIAGDATGDNDGTVTGDTAWVAGKVNGGLRLDGADGRIAIGTVDGIALTETRPFSISAWIDSEDVDRWQAIASNYQGERGGRGQYSTALYIYRGDLFFAINMRQTGNTEIKTPISAGWHFVVATYDGSRLALHIDGVLKTTGTRSFSGSTPNTRGWDIGDYSPETVAVHGARSVFYGTLDEVALYDKALSETEAQHAMGPTVSPEVTVAVPDVVGLEEPDAVEAIFDAGLVPARVEVWDDPTPVGLVIASDPPAGTRVAEGSTVTISTSMGPTVSPEVTVSPVPGTCVPPECTGCRTRLLRTLCRHETTDENTVSASSVPGT